MSKRLPSLETAMAHAGSARFNAPNHGPAPRAKAKRQRPAKQETINPQDVQAHSISHDAPIKLQATRSDVPVRRGLSTRAKVGIGVGAGGTVAAGGYGTHKLVQSRRQRESAMSKSMINPFEEVVVFGKAVALPVPSAVRIRTPNLNSGSHRGNALALVRVSNSSGGGGPATALERYTTSPKGGKQGPFGRKGNSKIPDGARVGVRIGKRDEKASSGDPSTKRRWKAQMVGPLPDSREGKKGEAYRTTIARTAPSSLVGGGVAMHGLRRGSKKQVAAGILGGTAAASYGADRAVHINNRKGRLKAER